MVLQERIELSTSPLPRECSTTELLQHLRRAVKKRSASCHSKEGMARRREALPRPRPRFNPTLVARAPPMGGLIRLVPS